ncbi:FHA domain-containing protein [Prosthecobacter algae]|uniref:FHA domain-containing protein n=1 Tax=Prosthecobacter algae TaxID=1144682 RepID=UPI0031F0F2ED
MPSTQEFAEIVVDGLPYRLTSAIFKIGRSEANDAIIDEASVSTAHAIISREGGVYGLTDLGSSNGTFINGKKITTAPLHSGDMIAVGGVEILFRNLRPISTPKPPPSQSIQPSSIATSLDSNISDVAGHNPPTNEIAVAIRDTYKHFRELDYNLLFPLRRIFSPSFISKRAVTWVLTFGLFPMLISLCVLFFGLRFEQSAWLIGGYFCYFWAVYFNGLIRPQRPLWKRGLGYFIFTSFVGIPLLLAWKEMPIIADIYLGSESENFIIRAFGFVAGVGVFEETCKALPLLFFSLRRSLPIREGIFLGLMSGLGFALAEVVLYSVNYWQQSAQLSALVITEAVAQSMNTNEFVSRIDSIVPKLGEHYGSTLTIQIVRFIPLPLLHAVWAGTVGWFVAIASERKSSGWPIIVVGIVFMAITHGLYNVFSNGILGLVIAAFSILSFFCYLLHAEEVEPKPSKPEQPVNS